MPDPTIPADDNKPDAQRTAATPTDPDDETCDRCRSHGHVTPALSDLYVASPHILASGHENTRIVALRRCLRTGNPTVVDGAEADHDSAWAILTVYTELESTRARREILKLSYPQLETFAWQRLTTRYFRQRCRCPIARAAARRYIRIRREFKRATRVEIDGQLVAVNAPSHGSASIYDNWGCRCILCIEAKSISNKTRSPD